MVKVARSPFIGGHFNVRLTPSQRIGIMNMCDAGVAKNYTQLVELALCGLYQMFSPPAETRMLRVTKKNGTKVTQMMIVTELPSIRDTATGRYASIHVRTSTLTKRLVTWAQKHVLKESNSGVIRYAIDKLYLVYQHHKQGHLVYLNDVLLEEPFFTPPH